MRPLIRTGSFFSTWLAELLRQPLLLVGLVAGPFLILIAFGQGVDYSGIKPEVIVVRAESPDQPLRPLPEEISEYVEVVGETTDLHAAIDSLRSGDVEGVAVIPSDPAGTIREGEAIPIQIFTSAIDPIAMQFTEAYLRNQVAQLNQQTLAEAIQDAQGSIAELDDNVATAQDFIALARTADNDVVEVQGYISDVRELLGPIEAATAAVIAASNGISFVLPGISIPRSDILAFQSRVNDLAESVESLDRRMADATSSGALPTDAELDAIDQQLQDVSEMARSLSQIPPEVLSAPFVLDLENVAPFDPTFTGFFSPAVLVLLLQHLGVSLAALSMTRVRLSGLVDMLRVAPIRTVEVLNGNYLSYAVLIGMVAIAALVTMVIVINVPMYGSYLELSAVILLLTLVALGVGFAVAMSTASEQSAAQVAMLMLLASVFFSGMVVSLERIAWPMKAFSYALPSTYAIRTVQDIMLRGVLRHPEDLAILGAAAVLLYLGTFALLRRQFSAA